MFETFKTNNLSSIGLPIDNGRNLGIIQDDYVNSFFDECGGLSFRKGLYKSHNRNSSIYWTTIIGRYFVQHKDKIIPFGFDWMGRQFALDKTRKHCLLMFDPSTNEFFELNQDIVSFHNVDLVNEIDAVLSENSFQNTLLKFGISEIKYNDCFGFKTPLFLGGKDSDENFEISDLEVYWEIQCQIYLQIKDLSPGTKINSVKFE